MSSPMQSLTDSELQSFLRFARHAAAEGEADPHDLEELLNAECENYRRKVSALESAQS